MDLTTTTIIATTPDTENGTPPQTHPIMSLSFTNGALKNHHHHHPPPAMVVTVAYKECLKNHAASLGGHALDGCGEFMPSPTATPTDPTSLKCAACGCHRNFHRREPDDTTATHFLEFHRHPPPPHRNSPSPSPPPPPPNYSYAPDTLLALRTAVPEDRPKTNHHHMVATPVTPMAVKGENSSGRKRFRTKFSQDQKEKMLLFAEKLGWKMQKCDDVVVEKFCGEVGVGKNVLKVWLHNNKTTLGKRDTNNNNGRISFDNNGHVINNQNESSGGQIHVSTNGSSSSS